MRAAICVGIALFLSSTWAQADVAPPNMEPCLQKKAGDDCVKRTDNKAGKCKQSKCTRNDYSDGSPPKQVEYDCLLCADVSAGDPVPPKDGGNGGNAPPAPTPDAKATKDEPAKSGGGCHVGDGGLRVGFALMLLCFGFFSAWRMGKQR